MLGKNKGANFRDRKILTKDDLPFLREQFSTKKIVQCHGVFDVIHAGHLAYFESAKKYGDLLIVTLTADAFVNKGPGRPYFNARIRANMVAALEVVDYVYVNNFPTATPCIELIKPHFYVKGPDYRDKSLDPTGAIYDEEGAVEKGGGKLVFTSDDTFSSSFLINNFFPAWNDEQQIVIEQVKKIGGLALIEEYLDKISKLSITITGEPIIDTYVFCKPEAISSKSPCLSAKYLYQEDYAGGTLAIANHLSDFVNRATIVTTHGSEDWFLQVLKEKMDSRINVVDFCLKDIPSPRKTRYIADDKRQRLFELTDLQSDQWESHNSKDFIGALHKEAKSSDALIVADFGHGLFENKTLEALQDIKTFIALNVQTNSSNVGFNPFTKHRNFSYLSIDLKEARVAYQDRFSQHLELYKKVKSYCDDRSAAVAMTLGPMGAYYGSANQDEIKSPAFADTVVDAVGAGDAFFSITSLFVKVGAPDPIVPFVGNVFAGLKTKVMGNKSSVTKAQLIKAITAILK
ncbi:MAG: PfkB family carbohydrate kinase [Oligoflexia bacterium]|nr:PfkB family carbohydrate kinase [Oligoflexia bacterium]